MNVLAADKLMLNPKLYSTFLLWLLSELYTQLPEVGDLPLPKLIFFFDEAHMLFKDTSKALVDKIEQVIRLVRSKGVGVYFVTQSPDDIPEVIAGQLGNRILHGLRAYTPKEQKAVKAAAQSFRTNPNFNTEAAILELGTGEALVSLLDEKGAPCIVERAKILFPLSQIGAITEGQRDSIIKGSRIYGKYDKALDRESAFEVLLKEMEKEAKAEEEAKAEAEKEKEKAKEEKNKKPGLIRRILKAIATAVTAAIASIIGTKVSDAVSGKKTKSRTSAGSKITKSATQAATRQITRDILGNLIK